MVKRVAVALVLALAVALLFAPRLDLPLGPFDRGPDLGEVEAPPPVAPEPLPRQLFGVQLHPFFDEQTDATVNRELDLAQRTGANSIRVDLVWSSLQLEGPGEFDPDLVERVDSVLEGAGRRGLHVVLMLWSTPCWASSAPESQKQGCQGRWWERGVNAYPPRDPDTYALAAESVARRWGDRIAALEIWNEPNFDFFLAGPDPARDYGRMLRAAYPRIKAVRPDLPVLAGSLAHADGRFLTRLFKDGRIAGSYDAIAWHPYTYPNGPRASSGRQQREDTFRDGARWLRQIMHRNGDRKAELWATEAGSASCDPAANERCVSAATQARWTAEYAQVARDMPFLKALIFYNLRDNGIDTRDPEQSFGLVRRDFSAKPALDAFEAAARRGDR